MATNLNSVISTVQGVSTLWMLDYKNIDAGTGLIESMLMPSINPADGSVIGEMDCIGKFGEGTFSPEGDDASLEQIKYTDGSVAVTTITKGTYGFSGDLLNVNSDVCKAILGMKDATVATSAVSDSFGEANALGLSADGGFIENAIFYIEFDKSNAYKGMLIFNAAVGSKYVANGDSTETQNINMQVMFNEAPASINIAGTPTALTSIYAGMYFALIEK